MKKQPFYAKVYYRVLSSLFGLFLLTLAVLVLSAAEENKLWSAIKGKESWVSKIGPLP